MEILFLMADISSNFLSALLYQWFPKCTPRIPRDMDS